MTKTNIDLSKVIAIKATKTYLAEDVGKLGVDAIHEDELILRVTPEADVEFYSEEDMEEPRRENFNKLVMEVIEKDFKDEEENVVFQLLGEIR